jgi:hypothetical protein
MTKAAVLTGVDTPLEIRDDVEVATSSVTVYVVTAVSVDAES